MRNTNPLQIASIRVSCGGGHGEMQKDEDRPFWRCAMCGTAIERLPDGAIIAVAPIGGAAMYSAIVEYRYS